jgi:hypothetical protein
MKRFLFFAVLLFAGSQVSGQGFNQALGIRGGLTSGIEYRYYTSDSHSIKALLGNRSFNGRRGLQLHALTEFYQYDVFDFSYQLVLYYGAGAHVGYESWDVVRYQGNTSWQDSKSAFVTGVDVLAGVEYLFYEAPVTLSLEVKPFVDILGKNGFDVQFFDFAFTLKYLF